jgi:hypothetical protein
VAWHLTCDKRCGRSSATVRERRLSWTDLRRRVFEFDVLVCQGCGRRRQTSVIAEQNPPLARLFRLGFAVRALEKRGQAIGAGANFP